MLLQVGSNHIRNNLHEHSDLYALFNLTNCQTAVSLFNRYMYYLRIDFMPNHGKILIRSLYLDGLNN